MQFPQIGWEFYTPKDALAPRPPTQWVAHGVFALRALNILYGYAGSLKTMLMIDLAACVVSGQTWLVDNQGLGGFDVMQGAAVLLDFDNGRDGMHERVEAAVRERGLEENAPLYYVSMPEPWLDVTNKSTVNRVIAVLQAISPRLVVIDNLRTISGRVDENSGEMGTVMSRLRSIAESSGAAVVVIHHQRKGTAGKNGSRKGDSLRGHTSIEGAIDLGLLVTRDEGSDEITVYPTKTRRAPIEPFGAEFTYTQKGSTTDLEQFCFVGCEVGDLASNAGIRRIIEAVVNGTPGIAKTALVDKVREELPDVARKRIRVQLDTMGQESRLVVKAGARGASLFYPADPFDLAML